MGLKIIVLQFRGIARPDEGSRTLQISVEGFLLGGREGSRDIFFTSRYRLDEVNLKAERPGSCQDEMTSHGHATCHGTRQTQAPPNL